MNTNTQISLGEFASLISAVGRDVTVLGQGEPAIGKSAVFHKLKATPQFAEYTPLYLDCTLLDVGDLQIPVFKDGAYAFTPNAMFVSDKPMFVMLDEIGKAPRPVQNSLLPLLNGEKRIGNHHLHPESVVFATTNLATDGVGDSIQAHAKSRMCVTPVRKPNAEEWTAWGMDNNIDPSILAWVNQYPHALASYTDLGFDQDNPYVFNPRKQQTAYASPRSLAKASYVSKQRHLLSPQAFISALTGTVGESAARDMSAFFALGDALPGWKRVITTPATCPVPEDTLAQIILAMGAVQRLDKASVTPWLEYMNRMHKETQALFATHAMASKSAALLVTNKGFTQWAMANNFMF